MIPTFLLSSGQICAYGCSMAELTEDALTLTLDSKKKQAVNKVATKEVQKAVG